MELGPIFKAAISNSGCSFFGRIAAESTFKKYGSQGAKSNVEMKSWETCVCF
jgi:hypothetical protein